MVDKSFFRVISGYVGLLVLGSLGTGTEQDWKERFVSEAPKGWRAYLDSLPDNLVIVAISERRTPSVEFGAMRSRMTWRRMKGCYLRLRELENAAGEVFAQAEGQNEHYYFSIEKRPMQDRWTLLELRYEKDENLPASYQFHISGPLCLWNLNMLEILEDADFRIVNISKEQYQDKPAVRLEFEYTKPPEKYPFRGGHLIRGGWAILNPQQYWLLLSYSVYIVQHNQRYWFSRTFELDAKRAPLGLIVSTITSVPGEEESYTKYEFLPNRARPEEFRLSYFGLPEPQGLSWPKPTPWWLYMILSGLALVAIGLAIYAYRRWRKRQWHGIPG